MCRGMSKLQVFAVQKILKGSSIRNNFSGFSANGTDPKGLRKHSTKCTRNKAPKPVQSLVFGIQDEYENDFLLLRILRRDCFLFSWSHMCWSLVELLDRCRLERSRICHEEVEPVMHEWHSFRDSWAQGKCAVRYLESITNHYLQTQRTIEGFVLLRRIPGDWNYHVEAISVLAVR